MNAIARRLEQRRDRLARERLAREIDRDEPVRARLALDLLVDASIRRARSLDEDREDRDDDRRAKLRRDAANAIERAGDDAPPARALVMRCEQLRHRVDARNDARERGARAAVQQMLEDKVARQEMRHG